MEEKPTVSILTANYNKSLYLKNYFESILHSEFDDIEVIFVDDGSNDDSLKIANKYFDRLNLKIVSLENNLGFANALNLGLAKVKGEFVMRLDSDDFMQPTRIGMQVDFLQSHPEVDILGSNTYYYNESRKSVVGRSSFPESNNKIIKEFHYGNIALCHSAIMGRGAFYKKFKYNQSTFPFEEYDIFCKMIKAGGVFQNLREPLTFYRMYNQNASYMHIFNREKGINLLRKNYFNQSSNRMAITLKSLHRFFYRKSILGSTKFSRVLFLIIAALCLPKSVVKRNTTE